MRIGFVIHPVAPNVNYRAGGPAAALARVGHRVDLLLVQADQPIDVERLSRCDVVHVYRITNPETLACVAELQRRGVAVSWDDDDDLRLFPAAARRKVRIAPLQAERLFRDQRRMLRQVDLVTTPSPTIAKRFTALGTREVLCIPNFPQPEEFASPEPHSGVTIGWLAGLEHEADAKELGISKVLARTLQRHADVRVVTIGVRLDLPKDRYEHHHLVPFFQLRDHLRRMDIGIAPIMDMPMNHARSDVKIKEYAAAGVPWLASARGPYLGYGPAEGGFLVADADWEASLEVAIASTEHRAHLRQRAIEWGKSQSIDRHVGLWVDAFERAIANRASEKASAAPRAR